MQKEGCKALQIFGWKRRRVMEVGTLVKVVDNVSGHEFRIGETVKFRGGVGQDEFEYLDGSDYWFLVPEDYNLLGCTEDGSAFYKCKKCGEECEE
jgi:hypothetical protein